MSKMELAWVEIRRNADGVIRKEKEPVGWHGDSVWSDGNFSCDCYRALFFCDAAYEERPCVDCSDGLYSVRIKDLEGKLLYEDGDPQGWT
jgi:hypothetical protein